MLYVDASILVPCYAPEPWSAEAESLILDTADLAVSNLTIAETKNALIRKLKGGRLQADEVDEALARIDAHVATGYFLHVVMPPALFLRVPMLSREAPVFLRTADALHLAMALHLGADLATVDADLRIAAKAREVAVFPVVQPTA